MKVLSIEQMHNLESLGLDTSNASMYYEFFKVQHYDVTKDSFYVEEGYHLKVKEDHFPNYTISTYTLEDILDTLPFVWYKDMGYMPTIGACNCSYVHCNGTPYDLTVMKSITKNTNIEAAYDMLIWCIENGYLLKK